MSPLDIHLTELISFTSVNVPAVACWLLGTSFLQLLSEANVFAFVSFNYRTPIDFEIQYFEQGYTYARSSSLLGSERFFSYP